MDTWNDAHSFLLNMQVGDFYLAGGTKISCIKRDKNKIFLSNGVTVRLQKFKDSSGFYLASNKSITQGKRRYDYVNTILRDIEGYLIYRIHSNF